MKGIFDIEDFNNRYRRREYIYIEENTPFCIWNGENHQLYLIEDSERVKLHITFEDENTIPFYGYIVSDFNMPDNNPNVDLKYIIKVLGLRKYINFQLINSIEFLVFENQQGNIDVIGYLVNPSNILNQIYIPYTISGFPSMYEDCRNIIIMGLMAYLTSRGLHIPFIFNNFLYGMIIGDIVIYTTYFYNIFNQNQTHLAFSYGNFNIRRFKLDEPKYINSINIQTNAILPIMFPTLYDFSYKKLVCPNIATGQAELLIGKTYTHRNITNINFLGFGKKSFNVLSSITYLEHDKIRNYFYFSILNPPFLFKESKTFNFAQFFLGDKYKHENREYLLFYDEDLTNKDIKYDIKHFRDISEYQNIFNIPSNSSQARVVALYHNKLFYILPIKQNVNDDFIKYYKNDTIINYPNFIDYDNYYDIDLGISCELVYDINPNFEYINNPSGYLTNINFFTNGNENGTEEDYKIKLVKFNVIPKTKVCFFDVKGIDKNKNKNDIYNDDNIIKIGKIKAKSVKDLSYSKLETIKPNQSHEVLNLPKTNIKKVEIFENEIPYYVNSIELKDYNHILFTLITFIPNGNLDKFNELVSIPLDIILFSIVPSLTQNSHIPWLKVFHYKKTKELKHNLIMKEDIFRNVIIRIFKGKLNKSINQNNNKILDINISDIQLLNKLDLQNINIFTIPTFETQVDNKNVIYKLLTFNKLFTFIYNVEKQNNGEYNISYEKTTIESEPFLKVITNNNNNNNNNNFTEVNLKIKAISNFLIAQKYIQFRNREERI